MLAPEFLRSKFAAAQSYEAYVATATAAQRPDWERARAAINLKPEQAALVAAFFRSMNVLALSGTWCGDCVQQCPMLHAIASVSPAVRLRFLDRDQNLDLAERVRICGGLRVPTVLFLNEDFEFVSILGDRTLARYRAMAARKLGAACPLPGALPPADEMQATLQDWLDEFERVHLLLCLSPKLQQRAQEGQAGSA